MYFGIKYAVKHVDADPDLAGLLITGAATSSRPEVTWAAAGRTTGSLRIGTGHGRLPFDTLRQSSKPVVAAVNGLCQGGGLQIALCADIAVISDRATFRVPELYRGIADTYYSHMLARLIGPVRTRDLMFTGRTLSAAEALDWAWSPEWSRTTNYQGPRNPRAMLPHRTRCPHRHQVQPGQLHRALRPDRNAVESRRGRIHRRVHGVQGTPIAQLGASRPESGRTSLMPWPLLSSLILGQEGTLSPRLPGIGMSWSMLGVHDCEVTTVRIDS